MTTQARPIASAQFVLRQNYVTITTVGTQGLGHQLVRHALRDQLLIGIRCLNVRITIRRQDLQALETMEAQMVAPLLLHLHALRMATTPVLLLHEEVQVGHALLREAGQVEVALAAANLAAASQVVHVKGN